MGILATRPNWGWPVPTFQISDATTVKVGYYQGLLQVSNQAFNENRNVNTMPNGLAIEYVAVRTTLNTMVGGEVFISIRRNDQERMLIVSFDGGELALKQYSTYLRISSAEFFQIEVQKTLASGTVQFEMMIAGI